ncbi:hypothetical protein EI42_04415 [Thermosporothrix hazakensis]|jgi:hypothetical protein|uniref:Uncharacterized protein n=2 Tax=Thermosporothrix TaxID=768650 RepID=A0A326U3L8_THEHA|nr:hypothetical protein [Thermosporothrix hazakensis]PZW25363.1 hypothetical protein EI42_04415 [Thermosporothrix hazakensis]BBH87206.1 hypothetical protein KTC_19570 [Thermosporothrix sp. COM3]GCE50595.1 hypothetical protein KTH_54640 [Thermosporothrix hazakensis]
MFQKPDFAVAEKAFFDCLHLMNGKEQKEIQELHQKVKGELSDLWTSLLEMARWERQVQLTDFLCLHARERALYQFEVGAVSLSPATPGLREALRANLERKYRQAVDELQLEAEKARRNREREAEPLVQRRIQGTEQLLERQLNLNGELQQRLFQSFEAQSQLMREMHADSRQSLQLAMTGVQQLQQGLPAFVTPALELVKTSQAHLQQHLPSSVEEATVRMEGRKFRRKLVWLAIVTGVLILLPLVAYGLLQLL